MNSDNLIKAAVELALDNGGINRSRSKEQFLEALNDWCQRKDPVWLSKADQQLGTLSDEQLQTAVGGEMSEIEALMKDMPEANSFLSSIFEEVL